MSRAKETMDKEREVKGKATREEGREDARDRRDEKGKG